jgi:diguanylate cyclase (GGDEF)-like protein/PAS domain S-box-containing protein
MIAASAAALGVATARGATDSSGSAHAPIFGALWLLLAFVLGILFMIVLAAYRDRRKRRARGLSDAGIREAGFGEEAFAAALAVRGANDGVWDWDLIRDEVYYSTRFKSMLGYDVEEVGRSPSEWLDRLHPEDSDRVRVKLDAHLRGESAYFEEEQRLRHKDGHYRWYLGRGMALRDASGVAYRIAGLHMDVTNRRVYDVLTGLPNRSRFVERLGRSLQRAQWNPSDQFGVVFIDVDRFKVVSASLGPFASDQLLVAIARRLEGCLRPSDMVARLGGDEFALLVDHVNDTRDAVRIAERVQKSLAEPFDIAGREVFSSASMGIALSASGYTQAEDLFRDADAAMYRAKAAGPMRYEVFDVAMREHVVAQLHLENDLRRAVERREFRLLFQPVVGLRDGRLAGFEALARWIHPSRGIVVPSEFIPVAETTGVITPLGLWILDEAMRAVMSWRTRFASFGGLHVSVNVSVKQLRDTRFLDHVRRLLDEHGVDPEALRIEITESAFMETKGATPDVLAVLKSLGVRLQIDDFGTGYSSLNYLRGFPIDALKIDQSFVAEMPESRSTTAIVETIVALAHNLGMTVIAEGVESGEQVARLRTFGCEQAQGRYFAMPLEPEAVEDLLDSDASWFVPPPAGPEETS